MDITTLAGIVVNLAIAVLIGLAGWVVAELMARITEAVTRRYLDKGLTRFLKNVVRVGILLFTLKLIVDQTGAAGLLVVVVTALTGAFAIGSERLASDFVAGLNLFVLRYYKVGDVVTIGSHFGEVQEITLTHTILSDFDRNAIIIPNSESANQIIINHTAIPGLRVTVFIPVFGPHDHNEAMRVLLEAAKSFELTLSGPDDKPSAWVMELEPLCTRYRVRIYVANEAAGCEPQLMYHLAQNLKANNFVTQLPLTLAGPFIEDGLTKRAAAN